jgi:hypothetical protein
VTCRSSSLCVGVKVSTAPVADTLRRETAIYVHSCQCEAGAVVNSTSQRVRCNCTNFNVTACCIP